MLLFYLANPSKIAASLKAVYEESRGPKRDRCPECGGTDYFDGYGVCQLCESF